MARRELVGPGGNEATDAEVVSRKRILTPGGRMAEEEEEEDGTGAMGAEALARAGGEGVSLKRAPAEDGLREYLVFNGKAVGMFDGEDLVLFSEKARETLKRVRAMHYALGPDGDVIPIVGTGSSLQKLDLLRQLGVDVADDLNGLERDRDGRWLMGALSAAMRDRERSKDDENN